MEDFGTRIKIAADQVGGLDRLADRIPGMSRRSLSDYVNGKTDPRASLIAEIATATGTSAGWILTGEGEPFPQPKHLSVFEQQMLADGRRQQHLAAAQLGIPVELVPNHYARILQEQGRKPDIGGAPQGDARMVPIPFYDDVRASAGHGALAGNENQSTLISLDLNWLLGIGAQPGATAIIICDGDSMEPTIRNGAPMVVNTAVVDIRNGHIYVFNVDDDIVVKRVERLFDGTYDLISDNRNYPIRNVSRQTVTNMNVIGRVHGALNIF